MTHLWDLAHNDLTRTDQPIDIIYLNNKVFFGHHQNYYRIDVDGSIMEYVHVGSIDVSSARVLTFSGWLSLSLVQSLCQSRLAFMIKSNSNLSFCDAIFQRFSDLKSQE